MIPIKFCQNQYNFILPSTREMIPIKFCQNQYNFMLPSTREMIPIKYCQNQGVVAGDQLQGKIFQSYPL
jgi:hypothetical protein